MTFELSVGDAIGYAVGFFSLGMTVATLAISAGSVIQAKRRLDRLKRKDRK